MISNNQIKTYVFNPLSARTDFRRQNLTFKVGLRTEIFKIFIVGVNPYVLKCKGANYDINDDVKLKKTFSLHSFAKIFQQLKGNISKKLHKL